MSAGAWLVLVIVALMICVIVSQLKKRDISDEDFEREAKRPSLIRTGLQEFQGFLEPEKKAAIEVVKEEKRKADQVTAGEPPQNKKTSH